MKEANHGPEKLITLPRGALLSEPARDTYAYWESICYDEMGEPLGAAPSDEFKGCAVDLRNRSAGVAAASLDGVFGPVRLRRSTPRLALALTFVLVTASTGIGSSVPAAGPESFSSARSQVTRSSQRRPKPAAKRLKNAKEVLRILVRDGYGRNVRGVEIKVRSRSQDFGAADLTDDTGEALFLVRPGNYAVRADRRGQLAKDSVVSVRVGTGRNTVVIRLSPLGSSRSSIATADITGTLRLVRVALAGQVVDLDRAAGGRVESARTNDEGKFNFRGVALGRYFVRSRVNTWLEPGAVKCLLAQRGVIVSCPIYLPNPVFRFSVEEKRRRSPKLEGAFMLASGSISAGLKSERGPKQEGFAFPLKSAIVKPWGKAGMEIDAYGLVYRLTVVRAGWLGDVTQQREFIIAATKEYKTAVQQLIFQSNFGPKRSIGAGQRSQLGVATNTRRERE